MQPINRVLLVLILAGAAVFYWMRQQARGEYDRQVGALAATLDRRYLSPEASPAEAEAMFRRALVIYHDYRSLAARGRLKTGEDVYLKESLAAAGYTSDGEIGLVMRNLRQNLSLCLDMKILGSEEGAQTLLSPRPPVIRAGSFKGDTLVTGRRIPAALAPDLANHPANLSLIPSNASAMVWPYALTEPLLSAVTEFRDLGILDQKTAQEIKLRADRLNPPAGGS